MSISTTPVPVALTRRAGVRAPAVAGEGLTAWALAFALVFYLALRGGGYDAVIRDDVGILVWWMVLLAAVAGLMPRLSRAGWVALAALAAWAAWTALGIPHSETAERTLGEAGRLSTYVGVLALALVLQGRAGARHVINGVACAIGAATVLAVLSRLHPQWFPDNSQIALLPAAARRLSYPLNYWNGLACFMAMGAVLLLGVASTARTRVGQAMAAAVIPLCGLGIAMAVSRAGALLIVAGALVLLLLAADRLAVLASTLVAGGGAAILVVALGPRHALRTGLDSAAARSEGAELLWLCLIVCLGVALLQVAIGLLARHVQRPRILQVSRRTFGLAGAVLALAAVVVFFGSGLHHEVADQFHAFKQPPTLSNQPSDDSVFSRLQSSAGEGRWQYWEVAMDAFSAHPLRGIGGDSFNIYWQRHATVNGAIVDAHNLYVQTLAEAGLVGGLLLAGLLVLSVGGGAVRTLRTQGGARTLAAAATAAAVVFWLEATIDWVWQIAVLPAVMLLLMAATIGPRDPEIRPARLPVRGLAVLAAIAAFFPIAFGLSTLVKVRASQQAATQGRLDDALVDARDAQGVSGTSTSAVQQEALVLERQGALQPALQAAIKATRMEPTNWTTWLVRARLEARLGDDRGALKDFRTAKRLNPQSPLFDS